MTGRVNPVAQVAGTEHSRACFWTRQSASVTTEQRLASCNRRVEAQRLCTSTLTLIVPTHTVSRMPVMHTCTNSPGSEPAWGGGGAAPPCSNRLCWLPLLCSDRST